MDSEQELIMGKFKVCFNCGGKMEERHGEYHFDPPPNIPGGTMVVPDATWMECEECGEQMLPAALDDQLEKMASQRLNGKRK